MLQTMDEEAQNDDAVCRRRGRPIGKNRVPLSIYERRARNAKYERERRYETSEAMAELAVAAHCDPALTNNEILAEVISQLRKAAEVDSTRDIEDLKRSNEKLTQQVEALEQRLSNCEDKRNSQEGYKKSTTRYGKRKNIFNRKEMHAKKFKSRGDSPLHMITSESDVKYSHDAENAVEAFT